MLYYTHSMFLLCIIKKFVDVFRVREGCVYVCCDVERITEM